MNRKRKVLLTIGVFLFLAIGLALTTVYTHSKLQLTILHSKVAYPTPEEGMLSLVHNNYNHIQKVEIVHSDRELFDNLYFVEAHVWAYSRSDGKGFRSRDYDNPGSFFLRMQDGWVFVPEGKFPEVIAFGMRLFNLSGYNR